MLVQNFKLLKISFLKFECSVYVVFFSVELAAGEVGQSFSSLNTAVSMLQLRVENILRFLKEVQSGKRQAPPALLSSIFDLWGQLKALGSLSEVQSAEEVAAQRTIRLAASLKLLVQMSSYFDKINRIASDTVQDELSKEGLSRDPGWGDGMFLGLRRTTK